MARRGLRIPVNKIYLIFSVIGWIWCGVAGAALLWKLRRRGCSEVNHEP